MSNPNRPFGWRKRIGLLSPTVIETAAYDFYRLAPEGVSMCATTSNIEHWSPENFHEDVLVKQIEDTTGLPATTSIRSAIRALAHLRVRNVAVVTPYPQELHQSALSFLTASGFCVVADHSMDVAFKRLQDVTPAQIFATAKRVLASAPSADGVYIPCNQWSGADAAPLIENELGMPVVTGAHADYWEAFRSLGITDRLEGHGRLMLSLSSNAAPAITATAARA